MTGWGEQKKKYGQLQHVDCPYLAPSTTTEVLDVLNITGKKAVYDIAIPKGDDHTWKDCRVDFFGESWRVFGLPKQGIDENVPGRWNQRWMVERYE